MLTLDTIDPGAFALIFLKVGALLLLALAVLIAVAMIGAGFRVWRSEHGPHGSCAVSSQNARNGSIST